VIGKQLDEHSKYKKMIDVYFKRLKTLKSTMKTLDARTKFMIADLFELRARKWKPRRDEKAPATIAQVRQQAAQEELNKRSASKNNSRSNRSKSHDRSSENRGGSERRGGSFNMPTVFSSSSSSKNARGSRSQNSSNTGRGQQSQSLNRYNNNNNKKSSGSRLNLQPQRGSRGDDSKKSTTKKPISVEDYKKKCKSTVNEYLCSSDLKEVKVCLAEYVMFEHDHISHENIHCSITLENHSNMKHSKCYENFHSNTGTDRRTILLS